MKRFVLTMWVWVLVLLLPGAVSPAAPLIADDLTFLPLEPAPLAGPQPFLTILCRFPDQKLLGMTPYETMLGDSPPGAGDYWREVSYGKINLDGSELIGWYDLPVPAAAYWVGPSQKPDLGRLALDCITAAGDNVRLEDYAGLNLVFNGWQLSRGGRVLLTLQGASRPFAVTWLWLGVRHNVLVHEMGHGFGLAHSSACDDEYANVWDVMSGGGSCSDDCPFGPIGQHPIAVHKDRLGWIPAERKFVAPAQGQATIRLERLALPGPDGYLMAQIPISGSLTHFYTVEARRRVGYDRYLPDDAIVIHEVDAEAGVIQLMNVNNDGDTRASASAWKPGMLFMRPEHGVAVAVKAETATGYVVMITTGAPP